MELMHDADTLGISIHALFAEGDLGGVQMVLSVYNFYPRPLRRGRQQICPIQFGIFDQFVYKLAAFEPVCVK